MKPTLKKSLKNEEKIKIEHFIKEFADCDPQMGLINNLYMKWADEFGANCIQCTGTHFTHLKYSNTFGNQIWGQI